MAETFGFDGIGSAANLGANCIWVSGAFSPASDGTLTNISFYGRDSGDKVKLALYDYADDSLIAGSDTEELALDATTLSWKTGSCSNPPAIYSNKQYWIVVLLEKACQGVYKGLAGVSIKYTARTYSQGFPATLGALSNWGTNFSLNILGIYEPAGLPTYYHGLKVQGVGELALCDVGSHPLRFRKGGTTYGIELVDTADPNASTIRIKTGAGIKAIRKYT